MKLEDSLNGGFHGLYGEVVTEDHYRMRDVEDIVSINDPSHVHVKGHPRGFKFTPDLIIDLGANVGVFSRYARSLFPKALIISVEPDQNNVNVFMEHTADDGIILIHKAVGSNQIYRARGAINGAMEVYMSANIGYSEDDLNTFDKSDVGSIMLTDLRQFIEHNDRVVLKIDIEGNELAIFNDGPSMDIMRKIDYITGELHYFAGDGKKRIKVVEQIDGALEDLAKTHTITIVNKYFYALKK